MEHFYRNCGDLLNHGRNVHAKCGIGSPIVNLQRRLPVKKLVFIASAAILVLTAPASAQGVSVGVGDARIGVGVDRHHHRDRWDSRAQYRDRDDVVVIKKKRYMQREYEPRRSRKTVIIER
jgi:hypothetical protein